MTRKQYVHLPDDDELVALFHAHADQVIPTAQAIGCSDSALRTRLRRMNIELPRTSWKWRVDRLGLQLAEAAVAAAHAQLDAIEALNRIGELEERVHRLEQQRVVAIDPRAITHRRRADGGVGGRRERAILRSSAEG